MSKKFGKFLLFTAAAGTAAAAYYFYRQKKETESSTSADEDYDDFSEDTEEDSSRSYVSLKPEDNSFTPLEKVAKTVEDASEKAEEAVEEFFDEGDATDEEPPIQDN